MRPRTLWRHASLTVRFALLSAAAMVILGVTMSNTLTGMVERRALTQTVRSAELAGRLLVQAHLDDDSVADGLTPSEIAAMDEHLGPSVEQDDGIRRLKVFNSRHEIVYSDDHALIGERFPGSAAVSMALGGATTSHVTASNNASGDSDR